MKTVLKVIGIVIAVLIVIAIITPFVINVNSFRPQIESRLSSALGRQVKVGNLSLSIFTGSVGADQLSIADDPKFSQAPFITAKSLKVGVELRPLIFDKQLNITDLVINQPDITLVRNQAGAWNYSSLGTQQAQMQQGSQPAAEQTAPKAAENKATENKPARSKAENRPAENKSNKSAENKPVTKPSTPPGELTVGKLNINDGKVTLASIPAKRQPLVCDKVNISVRNFSFKNSFPVTLSASLPNGGSLKVDGTAGPINAADTSLTPVKAKVNLNKLDLAQSAVVDPSLGLAGTADFDGTVDSDGHIATTGGLLKVTGLKASPKGAPASHPVEVKYAVQHDLQTESGRITQGDVAMGKAVAKLTGTYDMKGDTTTIRTKLTGQNMSVDDLQAMLPAFGIILPTGSQLKGGTLSVDVDSSGPIDKLVSTGAVKLSNTQLAGFNLGSKLQAISALSGKQTGNDTGIQLFSSNANNGPGGTQLSNINLVIPAVGTLVGTGTISPTGAINFKMAANLSGTAITGLSQIAGLGGKGTGSIPFLIQGTTSDPKFMPDVQGIVAGQLKGLLGNQAGTQQNQNQNQNPLSGLVNLFGKKKQPPPPK